MTVSALPGWIRDPSLDPFWRRVRARLESNGLEPHGRVTVVLSGRSERHALGALLGRVVTRDRVTVDLAALNARLAERSGVGALCAVVESMTGSPLRDRAAERQDLASRRTEPLELARSQLDGRWVEPWLAGLRSSGLLTNRADGVAAMTDAVRVLVVLLGGEVEPRSRVDLAAQLLGDAHALDQDRVVHQVVLRALAAASSMPVPAGAGARRELWERFGVMPDLVSSTCLTLGLSSSSGDPVHVTAWDLRRGTAFDVGSVLVCENPRVLEAFAERFRDRVPVVCTSGEPNTVVAEVLSRLVLRGCELRYHGDFDWPGIAITNRLSGQFGVRPWLMAAADYEAGLAAGRPALVGPPVEPGWDAELGAAMRRHGRAVHEETVIESLLAAAEQIATFRGAWQAPHRGA